MTVNEKNHSEHSTETIEIKEKKSFLKSYIMSLLDLRDNMMSYEDIDLMMREQTVIHGANMWILMLAILIASIGLNMNSTAVIIGAMLISPLMSGIMSMGYSVAVRDIPLLIKALVRFLTQVGICLITSVIYFSVSPLTTPTAEMIARTSPTLWDVLIAVFGGLAGMIGHTRTKHSNVIPGVAIATALMPPLCTAGYGIATAQLRFFIGAFYLFIINTLFIAISTAVVVLVLKVPYHKSISDKAQRRVNVLIGTISVAVIIPSIIVASYTVHDSYIDNSIAHYLEKEFSFHDTQVVKSDSDKQNHRITVSLVGNTISSEMISLLENKLEEYNLGEYTLTVTQNVFSEVENSDKAQIVILEHTVSELENKLEENENIISDLRKSLNSYEEEECSRTDYSKLSEKAEKIFTYLTECRTGLICSSHDETAVLTAVSEKEISETEKDTIRNWLAEEAGTESAELIISVKSDEESSTESDVNFQSKCNTF